MEEQPSKLEFAFQRKNYMLMLVGLLIVVVGFMLMSGGSSNDPNVFKGDYSLSDDSFDKLTGEYAIEPPLVAQLEDLRGQVFPDEKDLMEAIEDRISPAALEANRFPIRSSIEIDADMFSFRRISLAPLVILLGYGFILYAIMYRRKDELLSAA